MSRPDQPARAGFSMTDFAVLVAFVIVVCVGLGRLGALHSWWLGWLLGVGTPALLWLVLWWTGRPRDSSQR